MWIFRDKRTRWSHQPWCAPWWYPICQLRRRQTLLLEHHRSPVGKSSLIACPSARLTVCILRRVSYSTWGLSRTSTIDFLVNFYLRTNTTTLINLCTAAFSPLQHGGKLRSKDNNIERDIKCNFNVFFSVKENLHLYRSKKPIPWSNYLHKRIVFA